MTQGNHCNSGDPQCIQPGAKTNYFFHSNCTVVKFKFCLCMCVGVLSSLSIPKYLCVHVHCTCAKAQWVTKCSVCVNNSVWRTQDYVTLHATCAVFSSLAHTPTKPREILMTPKSLYELLGLET